MRIGTKMIRKLANEESGYSLVEVIVSIFILAAAILPMVGMLDMGLKSATTNGNYDAARALANTNLDKVRALSWSADTSTYQPTNATNPAVSTRSVSCSQGVFTCNVKTTYLDPNTFNASDPASTLATNVMQIDVTVTWQGKTYTTTGLKTKT